MMKRFNVRIGLFGLLFVVSCFGGGIQERTVLTFNTTALSLEAAQTAAEGLYASHQQLIVDLAGAEAPLPTQAVVQGRLAGVREAWAPVWLEFAALRDLYGSLAASLVEEGAAPRVEAAAKDFFEKQKALADTLTKLRDDYNRLKQGGNK